MIDNQKQQFSIRRVRAVWRDSILLFREFFWPLIIFATVIIGGGYLYFNWAINTSSEIHTPVESIYLVLSLTFLQPTVSFPDQPRLQAFFFLMPVIGAILIAQGVAEFSTLFFNRRARTKEWEMAVASTFSNHIVIIGLGHLGFQAIENLINIGQSVVSVEKNPESVQIPLVQAMGIPVIVNDANSKDTLIAAGVEQAEAIMICMQNDSLNLQIAIKARAINPDIRVVIRIFDHDFASALDNQFGFTALSASEMAGPSFAAAAAEVDITRPITVAGQALSMAKIRLNHSAAKLIGLSINEIEQRYNVSVILWKNGEEMDYHPPGEALVGKNESIIVLAGLSEITKILKDNHTH